MKWNESGFRPPLCTYRLNWARRTSWGWWDDWDDTVLQTQDSKFEPWRSEAEHATSRSQRLPTILTFTRGWGRNIFVSLKPPRPGTEPRTLAWKATVLTTTLGPPPKRLIGLQFFNTRHRKIWILYNYGILKSLCSSVHETNVVLIPAHRLRRWPIIKTTLFQRLVSAGTCVSKEYRIIYVYRNDELGKHWSNIVSTACVNWVITYDSLGGTNMTLWNINTNYTMCTYNLYLTQCTYCGK